MCPPWDDDHVHDCTHRLYAGLSDAARIGKALEFASHSTDRSRQVGCVIVARDGTLLSSGWNTTPDGVAHTEERHARPTKYLWTEHAERNAIYKAAREGRALAGATAYVPWFPCVECSCALINAGIERIVAYEPDLSDPTWGEAFVVAREMLEEAGVEISLLPGQVKAAS